MAKMYSYSVVSVEQGTPFEIGLCSLINSLVRRNICGIKP